MSEPKFTPGPWLFDPNPYDSSTFEVTNAVRMENRKVEIATIGIGYEEAFDEEQHANAALIVSAPDLYRELDHLVRLLQPMEADGSLNVPGLATLNGARAALARARGEA